MVIRRPRRAVSVGLWVIRAGSEGKFAGESLRRGMIAIGYDIRRSLKGASAEEIRKAYNDANHAPNRSISANQVVRFVRSIHEGDMVVTPLPDRRFMAVGTVVGDYEYDGREPEFRHQRAVRWDACRVPRSSFPGEIQTWLSPRTTLREYEPPGMEARIRMMLPMMPGDGRPPEIDGFEEFVWEALDRPGRTIGDIEAEDGIGTGPGNQRMRDDPVWHSEREVISHVSRTMGWDITDYGADMSRNPAYMAIARVIGDLRRNGVLVDLAGRGRGAMGRGVWRLSDNDATVGRSAARQARKEMLGRNFYCAGRESLVYVREKQGEFRRILMKEYDEKCAICGFGIPGRGEFLVGAHIVPYSDMRRSDPGNSMNPSNGLLLCRLCDAAFERHRILVYGDYARKVDRAALSHGHPVARSWIRSIRTRLRVPRAPEFMPNPVYLGKKARMRPRRG